MRGVLGVVVLVAVAAGCGADDGGTTAESDHRVAVAADSTRFSGSELAPGVEVQDGSSLVGRSVPVVPYWEDLPPVGWQALLIVDGDPVVAWDRYADELDLGEAGRAVNSCRVLAIKSRSPGDGPVRDRVLTEDPIEGVNRLDCGVTTDTRSMVMAVGAASCDAAVDAVPCGERAVAHLYIVASDPLVLLASESRRPTGPVPDGPIRRPNLPEGLSSRLPDEGKAFDDGIDYLLARSDAAVLLAGARALVAPAMLHNCNSGLAVAVEMPGTPEQALRMMDEANDSNDQFTFSGGVQDGEPWAAALIGQTGGYHLYLTSAPIRPGHSFVLVNECGD